MLTTVFFNFRFIYGQQPLRRVNAVCNKLEFCNKMAGLKSMANTHLDKIFQKHMVLEKSKLIFNELQNTHTHTHAKPFV